MEGEVVHHGDLVEFRAHLKCEGCQRGDRTCIIQRTASRCILCDSTGVECVFTRALPVRGLKNHFQWEWLLNEIPTRSLNEGLSMSRRRSSGGGPQPPGSHRTPEDFRKLWRIAFLVCQAVNQFRAVNQYKEKIINGAPYDGSVSTKWSTSEECFPSSSSIHKISGGSNMKEVDHALDPFAVFDVKSMQEVIPHRRRDLEGSNYAARVRKRPGGACDLCKRNKRKCLHVLEEDKAATDEPSGNTVTHETTSSSQGLRNGSRIGAHEPPLLADYHLTSQHTTDNRLEALWDVDQTSELIQEATAPLLNLSGHIGPRLEHNDLLIKSPEGIAQDSENLSPFSVDSHKFNSQSTMEPTAEREVHHCLLCQKTFHGTFSKSNLARHRKEVHTVRERYKCPAPGCLVTAIRKDNLKMHLERTHGKDWAKYGKAKDWAKYGKVDQSAA